MESKEVALRFFREWMSCNTKVSVNATRWPFAASGSGVISSLDNGTIWVQDAGSGFSMHVPLEGATFNPFDPERGSGDPTFDGPMRDAGFKFVLEVVLPDGTSVVFSERDMGSPSETLI